MSKATSELTLRSNTKVWWSVQSRALSIAGVPIDLDALSTEIRREFEQAAVGYDSALNSEQDAQLVATARARIENAVNAVLTSRTFLDAAIRETTHRETRTTI
jgi:hypothetical protein